MSNPLFSIITINYNDAEGLERTIKSVLDQSFTNYEHIIIDGASSDSSVEVIKKYEKLYPNGVLTWISEHDGGIYNAMNKGIKLAKGTWLNMMNAGDWFDADALKVVSGYIASQPNVEVFISPVLWRLSTEEHYLDAFREVIIYPIALSRQPLGHQGVFFKRSLHNQYGYYREDLRLSSDYAFEVEIFVKHCVSYHIINECFINFLDGGVGNSHAASLEAQQIRIEYGIIPNPYTPIKKLKKAIKWLLPYGVWAIKQRLAQRYKK